MSLSCCCCCPNCLECNPHPFAFMFWIFSNLNAIYIHTYNKLWNMINLCHSRRLSFCRKKHHKDSLKIMVLVKEGDVDDDVDDNVDDGGRMDIDPCTLIFDRNALNSVHSPNRLLSGVSLGVLRLEDLCVHQRCQVSIAEQLSSPSFCVDIILCHSSRLESASPWWYCCTSLFCLRHHQQCQQQYVPVSIVAMPS